MAGTGRRVPLHIADQGLHPGRLAGWYYALQRAVAEILIALEITDRRLRGNTAASADPTGDVP